MKEKICPFKFGKNLDYFYCSEDNCAWFIENAGNCAMLNNHLILNKILDILQYLPREYHSYVGSLSTNTNNKLQGIITVGTSQVEAKVGASRSTTRDVVTIHNKSNDIIYVGEFGVTPLTGKKLFPSLSIDVVSKQAIYLIASQNNNEVVITEIG
jgi:hypothetical protein